MNPFYIKDITKFSGHSAQRCFLSVSWIYYCHSSKSTGKETGKTYLVQWVLRFLADTYIKGH